MTNLKIYLISAFVLLSNVLACSTAKAQSKERREFAIHYRFDRIDVDSSYMDNAGGGGPTVIWGQEGLSTSSLSQSQGWASGVTAYGIRCVRNLGIDSDAAINVTPDDFLMKTENADGSVTFEATHLNAAALRDYTSTDLPYADEWSSANRLYKRFEVAPDYTDFSSSIGFATFQSDIDARGSYLSGYCPEGYRIPNQMELAMMNYYMDLRGYNLYSRTYWSFGPYSGNYGPYGKSGKAFNIGFMRISNGNLTVDIRPGTRYARCVKDIRMN